jgi:hypothetical protein
MRNHCLLYILLPHGEPGEFELIGESNSTLPVLWQVLLAQAEGRVLSREDAERIFTGAVEQYLAADALDALVRYRRVVSVLVRRAEFEQWPEVTRYLTGAQQHLEELFASWTVPGEPEPVFAVSFDEFQPWRDAGQVLREHAIQCIDTWRALDADAQSAQLEVLASICRFSARRVQLNDWRVWSDVFGLALFTHPYFAEAYRKPLDGAYPAFPNDAESPSTGSEDRLAIVQVGEHRGFLRADGTWHVQPEWHEVWPYANGAAVVLLHDRFTYIDAHGTRIVDVDLDEADDFTVAGVARVRKGRRWGLLRLDGTFALPLAHLRLEWAEDFGGWLAKADDRCLLARADGTHWIDDAWDSIDVLVPRRLIRVQRGRCVGALTWSGDTALACEYDSLTGREQSASSQAIELFARRDKRMGVVDATGVARVPFEFALVEDLEPQREGELTLNKPEWVRVYSLPANARPQAGVWDLQERRLRVPCRYDVIALTSFGSTDRFGFLVAQKVASSARGDPVRYRVGLLRADGSILVPLAYEWIGDRVALGRSQAIHRVREALHFAWSRGVAVEASRSDGVPCRLHPTGQVDTSGADLVGPVNT